VGRGGISTDICCNQNGFFIYYLPINQCRGSHLLTQIMKSRDVTRQKDAIGVGAAKIKGSLHF
jgi:hypothetical protein